MSNAEETIHVDAPASAEPIAVPVEPEHAALIADASAAVDLSGASETAPAEPRIAWEHIALAKNVPHWKAEAARIGRHWPIGFEVTAAEFDDAMDHAFNSRIG